MSQRMLFTKTIFLFEEDHIKFTFKTSSDTQTFFASYHSLDLPHMTEFSEQNAWLRNCGFLWIILGLTFLFIVKNQSSGLLWLIIGTITTIVSFATKTTYSKIGADTCHLMILKDGKHDAILSMIKECRIKNLRKYIGLYNNESYSNAESRFDFLLKEQAISQSEYNILVEWLGQHMKLAATDEEIIKIEFEKPLLN